MIQNTMQKSTKQGSLLFSFLFLFFFLFFLQAFLFSMVGIEDPVLNIELLPYNTEGS